MCVPWRASVKWAPFMKGVRNRFPAVWLPLNGRPGNKMPTFCGYQRGNKKLRFLPVQIYAAAAEDEDSIYLYEVSVLVPPRPGKEASFLGSYGSRDVWKEKKEEEEEEKSRHKFPVKFLLKVEHTDCQLCKLNETEGWGWNGEKAERQGKSTGAYKAVR